MENADNRIRLLLVEDERTLAGIIADTLSEKGFEVRCAYNGADGLSTAAQFRPEVVVTDIMMPTMDGFTFVRRLREEGICSDDVPVLFLSARSGAEDVVHGFELGIRKPFAMSELIVRIHALLGRQRARAAAAQSPSPIVLGRYTFDPSTAVLSLSEGSSTVLPAREAELLALLASRPGETVPNTLILKQLWGDDDYFSTRSLNVHITRLRKRLAADPAVSIISHRGVGYCLRVTA